MRTRKEHFVAVAGLLAALGWPLALHAEPAAGLSTAPALRPSGNIELTILQTTDLHHHANGVDHIGLDVNPSTGAGEVGTYARIAAYVKHVRATTHHAVVLVDSGDWTMGTFYDFTLGSRPLALRFIKAMRYDCITLGNHEFDYTPKGLARMLAAAESTFAFRTPIVASNMNLGGDPDLAPFFGSGKTIQTSSIEQLPNGLKIGYLGLMGKAAAQAAPGSAPVSFGIDYAAIQQLVDGLRQNGAHIVIVLSHSGTDATGASGEDVDLARHVTGIDLIASGHTHTPLPAAQTIGNGSWSTQIIDAGAFGTNVARLDLTYHTASGSVTLDGSSNVAMTDATLGAIRIGPHQRLRPDAQITAIVGAVDRQLNSELGPLFTATFPDYDPQKLETGIYHPVGVTAQDMVSNERNPVLSPNGLGDLTADALRSVPNAIIAQTLAAVGGNPANLPGYDFNPYQAAVVASGVLRSRLLAGAPLTFADIYNVLPLGISPDPSQALPIGYPTISAYLTLADVQKLCALQLVAQTNLVPGDFYLNLSGLQYSLSETGTYAFFKFATAAGVLGVTREKAVAGSTVAGQALAALATLGNDHGAALLAAAGAGNPYATAMVRLNDASPSNAQIAANLGTVGEVAAAAAADSAHGTNSLNALIVARAIAAISGVSGFAPTDGSNTGPVTALTGSGRVRIASDLYGVLLLGAVEAQFGVTITPYAAATGSTVLSGSDLAGVLANRIDAAPGTSGIQEMKEWLALLDYVGTGLDGAITAAYSSTPDFAQFGSFGAAVQTRNASYPVASVGQLATTLGGLAAAP